MRVTAEQLYLWGIPWDGAFVGAFLAALIAAAVSGLSWFFQHRDFKKHLKQSADHFKITKTAQERQDGFQRYTTAIGFLDSKSRHVQAEGVRILKVARNADWITLQDKELIQGALEDAIERIRTRSKEQ